MTFIRHSPWKGCSSGRYYYLFLRLRALIFLHTYLIYPKKFDHICLRRNDPSSCSRLISLYSVLYVLQLYYPIMIIYVLQSFQSRILAAFFTKCCPRTSTNLRHLDWEVPVNHLDSWMDRRQPLILSERRSPTARPLRHPLCLPSLSFAVLE